MSLTARNGAYVVENGIWGDRAHSHQADQLLGVMAEGVLQSHHFLASFHASGRLEGAGLTSGCILLRSSG